MRFRLTRPLSRGLSHCSRLRHRDQNQPAETTGLASRTRSTRQPANRKRCAKRRAIMKFITNVLIKLGILKDHLDYHLGRASMVLIFFFFGYQKWFPYEAQALIPYISHGPLIFWMYPVFGIRGATYFLAVSEWLFVALWFAGFWNKKLGILGALCACASMIPTGTSIPLIPDGWAASAGGVSAMTGRVAFLLKDIVIFAASFYLLKQDVARGSLPMGVPGAY